MTQMKRVEYIGPLRPGVIVRKPDGETMDVAFGEPFDAEPELAWSLLQQPDNWREPKPGPKPKPDGGTE